MFPDNSKVSEYFVLHMTSEEGCGDYGDKCQREAGEELDKGFSLIYMQCIYLQKQNCQLLGH